MPAWTAPPAVSNLPADQYAGRRVQGPQCAIRLLDLGIALGSAVKTAGLLNVDNRIMYRAGVVARRLGRIDADVVMGIPLSVTARASTSTGHTRRRRWHRRSNSASLNIGARHAEPCKAWRRLSSVGETSPGLSIGKAIHSQGDDSPPGVDFACVCPDLKASPLASWWRVHHGSRRRAEQVRPPSHPSPLGQVGLEKRPGIRGRHLADLLRRAFGHDLAAPLAALGPRSITQSLTLMMSG